MKYSSSMAQSFIFFISSWRQTTVFFQNHKIKNNTFLMSFWSTDPAVQYGYLYTAEITYLPAWCVGNSNSSCSRTQKARPTPKPNVLTYLNCISETFAHLDSWYFFQTALQHKWHSLPDSRHNKWHSLPDSRHRRWSIRWHRCVSYCVVIVFASL